MTVYFPDSDYGPLCTVEDVVERIEDEPSERLLEMVKHAILYASDEARFLGNPRWTIGNVPHPVSRIVASAVARWATNPDGLVQSRAGDETLAWSDSGEDAGSVRFTQREIDRIGKFAVRGKGFGTIRFQADTLASCVHDGVIYVPAGVKADPFPFVTVEDYHKFVVGGD